MWRSFIVAVALLGASAAASVATYRLTSHLCASRLAHHLDDLDWLRMEFRLSDAEMARVRQLHEGYLPRCRDFCDRIAAKQREAAEALGSGQSLTADAQKKRMEIAMLRARCQTAMLRHFADVSRVMPPAQGRRYLAEMHRLTLGFHDEVERSMSSNMPNTHGGR